MIHYGMIESYDCDTQRGTIQPNAGGLPLPFRKVDMQEEAAEPHREEYFGFETWMDDDGRQTAVHLHQLN